MTAIDTRPVEPGLGDPARVSAVQAARVQITALVDALALACETWGHAAAVVEVAAADEAHGRPTPLPYADASRAEGQARRAVDAARTALDTAVAAALTFGPLAEQDTLPARQHIEPDRVRFHDVRDDLAQAAREARAAACYDADGFGAYERYTR